MRFRYFARRGLVAFYVFVAVAAPLLVFLFPTSRFEKPIALSGSRIVCFNEREFISFRFLWDVERGPADALGLCLEAGIAVAFAVGVWCVYPAFRPLPALNSEGRVR